MTLQLLRALIYLMIFLLLITLWIGFLIHSHGTKVISIFGITVQVLIFVFINHYLS
jgi:hypothetical protein